MSEKKPLISQFNVASESMWRVVRLRGKPNDDGRITWIDFEIFDVPAEDTGNGGKKSPINDVANGLFYATDEFEMRETTRDVEKAVPSVVGFVKGDGCTQLWFKNNPVHFDGEDEFAAMNDTIFAACTKALQVMEESGGTW